MPRPAWFTRIVVGLLGFGGLLTSLGMLFGLLLAADSGMEKDGVGTDTVTVTHVEPDGPAARAGIVEGQQLRFASRGDQIGDALAHNGTTTHFVDRKTGRAVSVTYREPELPAGQALRLFDQALLAALALLIVFRAWTDPQARRLSILFAVLSNYVDSGVKPMLLILIYLFFAWMCSPWAIVAFARFGTGFPSMPPTLQKPLRIIAVVLGVAYFVALFASFNPKLSGLPALCWALVAAVGLAGLLLTYARASGTERRRVIWVVLSFVAGLGPIVAYEVYVYATRAPELWTWQGIPFLLLPLGMTYATLRVRVIDVGFALSRAGVFSVMTLLIAGIFGVLEALADKFLSQASHTESFIVELAITLLCVYLVRYFHHHIEHAIEHVVFAARNRRIKLIVNIADAFGIASHPDDISSALVERLRNDASIPAAVYVEEDGILRHAAGDATLRPDGSPAMHSFPLETFRRQRGTLVCELADDDEFAPDEAAALTRLAHEAAIARETARVDTLTSELEAARSALRQAQGDTV